MFDASFPEGWWYYFRSCHVATLTDEVIDINATTATRDGFEEEREWSRSFWSALHPYHTGVYVNFLMDEGQQRIRDAYGTTKYGRLRGLKRQYDPDNRFRLNQNIPPA
jgi:FAD/FMN-containing dehydrogenase